MALRPLLSLSRRLVEPRVRLRMRLPGERGLPSILVIGAQKSGTTSLYHFLTKCPGIAGGLRKEIHFFDLHFHRGVAWYRAHFPRVRTGANEDERGTRGGGPVRFLDASPYYLFHPLAAERSARVLEDPLVLAVLRDPVERAFSHYRHNVRKGREKRDFPEAVEEEMETLPQETEKLGRGEVRESPAHRHRSYVHRGFYAEQLGAWEDAWGGDRLMVLDGDRIFAGEGEGLERVLGRLGVPPSSAPAFPSLNTQPYTSEIPQGLRERLTTLFGEKNRGLERWLGRSPSWEA